VNRPNIKPNRYTKGIIWRITISTLTSNQTVTMRFTQEHALGYPTRKTEYIWVYSTTASKRLPKQKVAGQKHKSTVAIIVAEKAIQDNIMATQQDNDTIRKLQAWIGARKIAGYEHLADRMRIDAYDNIILWNEYGQMTKYGWEIDHELPKVHFPNLAQAPTNLRALHWRANRSKSDRIDLASLLKRMG